jgi:hypothetical protein
MGGISFKKYQVAIKNKFADLENLNEVNWDIDRAWNRYY